jgi:VWFA-related protein
VEVFDPSGKPETGLNQSNFTLFEDGKPLQMSNFRSVQGDWSIHPAEVILVLDEVNNSSGKIASFRKEVEKYLRQGEGPLAHPTSIAVLSDSGLKVGTPSRDRTVLVNELSELAGNFHGITCADATPVLECNDDLHEPCDPNPRLDCLNRQYSASVSAITSLVQKRQNTDNRTILVWIGQGWPLLNDNRFVPDTPGVKERFFHNLVEVSSAITESQVTVDSISSTNPLPVNPSPIAESAIVKGIPDSTRANAGSLALQALAYQSGGQFLDSKKDVAGQIFRCIADSESYYALTFETPAATRYGEYHSIEVKVNPPSRTVRTRTFFYGQQ